MTIITDDNRAIAARKKAQALHTQHGIRSLNEVEPHSMNWADLNRLEKDARKAVSDVLDTINDKATPEQRQDAESAADGLGDLLAAIGSEKDERAVTGSKEPRAQSATAARLAKRPPLDAVTVGEADDAPAFALRKDQTVRSWAQAKSPLTESVRGMTPGTFLRAMLSENKTEQERRALSQATDAAGGYTVPVELSAQLIDAARAASVCVAAGAQTIPLTSSQNKIAKVLTDPTPAWRAESGAVAESDPTFGVVDLNPQSLAVRVDISAELMQDTLNLAQSLPQILTAAMAVEMDRAALEGSGSSPEPRGILNTSGINTIAQGAASASYANMLAARTAILSNNRGPATAYIMSPREEGVLYGLANSNGDPLGIPTPVANIPWLTTTSINDARGTGTDESTIYCGNFAHLLMGIRQDIQVEVVRGPRYASNLEWSLIAHMRFDCAVEDPKAFTTITGVGDAA